MRYGRVFEALAPDQVVTPQVGINMFLNTEDSNLLWGKDIEGDIFPLYGQSVGSGFLEYRANIVQEGEDDPIVTEFSNNTGLTFTWARTGVGIFTVTPNVPGLFADEGNFQAGFDSIAGEEGLEPSYAICRSCGPDFLQIQTYQAAVDALPPTQLATVGNLNDSRMFLSYFRLAIKVVS